MHNYFLALLFAVGGSAYAQEHHKEINDQVWKPFKVTFEQYNVSGFMALHSHDLVRVPRDAKMVSNFNQYWKNNDADKKQSRENQVTRTIDLRFLERISSGTQAYEVGIYKVTITQPSKNQQTYYGKFHVVLRKEADTWKILVDSDSSEGGTIDQDAFEAAKPIE
jgi:ketosteroid isomerase-like protein